MEVSFQKTLSETVPAIEVSSRVDVVSGVPVESVTTVAPVDVTPATAIPTAPATTAVTVAAPAGPVAVANNPVALDDDNIGFEDIILPRINIVQKVGDLSNIFNGGEIVLNQQQVIHEPAFIHPSDPTQNTPGTGPLIFTVLGFRRRQFTEKVAGGKLGLLLNNESEIAAKNGTLDYKEWQQSVDASKLPGGAPAKRLFQRLATALCLVQKPAHVSDDDHVTFPYEFEGQFYCLVLWSMKGTAYTHAAKHLFTARKIGHLRTGYVAQQWSLTAKLEEFNGNFAYVPVIKPAAKNTAGFQKFARELLGSGN